MFNFVLHFKIIAMKTKQLIERNLKFTEKYIYLGITRGSVIDGQFCTCDNCGKLITNMVTVADNKTGKKYTIGTDCAETLVAAKCLYNNGNQTDYQLDIYAYNVAARFVTELNAGAKLDHGFLHCSLVNRKGKQITCSTFDLKKYFPEYLPTN